MSITQPEADQSGQGRHWSRHAGQYAEIFLDPFRPEVQNPIRDHIQALKPSASRTAIDLGCGTGPLLPLLLDKCGTVTALDFAPGMLDHARKRLGADAQRVTFLNRPMHRLEDLTDQIDLAVALNSLVMPDVRAIDQSLAAIYASLRPRGVFLGAVPAIDAIQYHTMLLMDRALDEGKSPEAAERYAAFHAEHTYYEFGFGRFKFQGLRQKFWHRFEVEFRLRKAGFSKVELLQVLYPWDDHVYGGGEFDGQPRSWDWAFIARR